MSVWSIQLTSRKMSSEKSENENGCLILKDIPGQDQTATNSIIFKQASQSPASDLLIFFGGDVQDTTEKMLQHRDHKNHARWSLDNVVSSISQANAKSHICAVKPNRMSWSTFSCYDNFVKSNDIGAPTHTIDDQLRALKHLQGLVDNLERQTQLPLSRLPKILVGFSKGVVVLNQLLHDVYLVTDSENYKDQMEFFGTVKSMMWLDGGHNGGSNTWITNKDLLSSLSKWPDLTVNVRVTPYQIEDDRRPWIKKEEKLFSNILSRLLGDLFRRKVYYEDQEPSIENHFRVLETLFEA